MFSSNDITKNKDMMTFLFRLVGLYLLWKICFSIIWRSPYLMDCYRQFSLLTIDGILYHTKFFLEILQYEVDIQLSSRIIRIVGTRGVTVGEPCIGFGVMAVFSALILSYPGGGRKKLWYIPLGLFVIHLMNIIRIALLTILIEINPILWELNHKFIFKIVIYGIVFLLWIRWINLHKNKQHENHKKNEHFSLKS